MAVDINNNSGGTTGSQDISRVTIWTGKVAQSRDDSSKEDNTIASVTGTWSERFDDPTYYA